MLRDCVLFELIEPDKPCLLLGLFACLCRLGKGSSCFKQFVPKQRNQPSRVTYIINLVLKYTPSTPCSRNNNNSHNGLFFRKSISFELYQLMTDAKSVGCFLSYSRCILIQLLTLFVGAWHPISNHFLVVTYFTLLDGREVVSLSCAAYCVAAEQSIAIILGFYL